MSRRFDAETQTLLDPITTGNLQFKSRTGAVFDAEDDDSQLETGDVEHVDVTSKYRNTISWTAYDPVNPQIWLETGCSSCGRRLVRYQRLGDEKQVIYVCICGQIWSR